MKIWIIAATAAALFAGPALAADEWGIEYEEKARFDATVVDILCELSGDCPENCGGGKRQLGLLKDDGTLILPAKNQDIFAGAANDLLPFCGRKITADGLLIKDPKATLFVLQFKRLAPDGEWSRATWFVRDWAEQRGLDRKSQEAKNWFRGDEQVKALIEADGVYGIPGLKPEE
ncbi:MAG: hypothetical protein GY791_01120 [Alphaproteobacteria bacterium]|nr:hypothetical protein [Alphaproteobacteria bacterium]